MSSIEIGSSATITSGSRMIARAITARCFWPPERSEGIRLRNRSTGIRPTRSRVSSTRRRSSSPWAMPWISSGCPTAVAMSIDGFSAAVGSWKIICSSVRSARSLRSGSALTSRERVSPPSSSGAPW